MSFCCRCVALLVAFSVMSVPCTAQPEAGGPRPGKYRIFTIPTAKGIPLFLGYFVLEGKGGYKAFTQADRPIGEGRYEFQASANKVVWTSGPYKDNKWEGRFFVSREGKTHSIYLTPSTKATNSTDSEK